jgi:glycosyltransferase involved in cell wall biosynthesis
MRLLMLITNYGLGGAERVFHDHATAFASRYDVEQAVFDGGGDPAHGYDSGLPSHEIRASGIARLLGPAARLASRSLELRRLAARRQYDLVVSHMDGANWVNALSMSRAKKIFVVHGSVLHDGRLSGWRQWIRTRMVIPLAYRRADVVVGVSEGIVRELRSLGVSNAVALPNFIDVAGIRRAAEIPPVGMGSFFERGHEVLVTTGRLSPQKNHRALLEVFAEVRRVRPRARLLLVGDGELRDALRRRALDLGLSVLDAASGALSGGGDADVVFAGFQRNPHQFVSRSTLFVLPSLWEGFPLALCEAMACGTAAVSADCPTGPREILAPHASGRSSPITSPELTDVGVLLPCLPPGADPSSWSSTISALLDDGAARTRMARAGASGIGRYDRAAVLDRWNALVEETVAGC